MFDWFGKRKKVQKEIAAHYARGRALEDASRYAEAEASYRAAAALDPRHARAHNNVGAMLHMQGRFDEALVWYRKALEIDPAQPEANKNYAELARDAGAHERAIEGYLKHLAANPGDAAALHQLGNTYVAVDRYDDALECFDRALALAPQAADIHFSRSFVLLQFGRYREGWREYEWRWRIEAFNGPARRFPQPMWNGEARPGGLVLIHGETGLGDMLQFVRYAPLVAERCAGVLLECQPALKTLLVAMEGVHEVRAQGEPLPPFAAHVPLIRLPAIFGTTLETIPWRGPYLKADPERVAQWSPRVPQEGKLKVGLAWTGNPEAWDAKDKFATLDAFAPLAQPGVTFYSLQKGANPVPPPGMDLRDLMPQVKEFADTAALVSRLDLVVAVDTSVPHLAAAMGVPTWVLLHKRPNWRFHLERSDNPWYPSMRLFRQERAGDWTGPVSRVRSELETMTK